MQHGIERVVIRPSQPCLDSFEYSASDSQMFYFGDLRYEHRSCTRQDPVYKIITLKPQQRISEFDLENENNILKRLDLKKHLTYSVWPSHEFKKNIRMNFY